MSQASTELQHAIDAAMKAFEDADEAAAEAAQANAELVSAVNRVAQAANAWLAERGGQHQRR